MDLDVLLSSAVRSGYFGQTPLAYILGAGQPSQNADLQGSVLAPGM